MIQFFTKTISSRLLLLALFVSFYSITLAQSSGIWQGAPITFTKTDLADWTKAANQDRITDSVWITRQDDKSIFNIKKNSSYGNGSPKGTQWSFGTTADIATLTFTDWITAVNNKPNSAVNKDMVLFLQHEGIYIDIKFTSFSGGGPGGGFEYIRSTDCRSFSNTDASGCGTYSSPSGKTWTTSGIHYDTLSNDQGCDSIIAIDVSIITVNVDVVAKGDTLVAQEVGAAYHWLNCDNNQSISGALGKQYITTKSGNYAVAILNNGCRDTSDCVRVQNSSIAPLYHNQVKIFPNPSSGIITVDGMGAMHVAVLNNLGQHVLDKPFNNSIVLNLEKGLYFIQVSNSETGNWHVEKIVVQ